MPYVDVLVGATVFLWDEPSTTITSTICKPVPPSSAAARA